jgi:hypothetical protein
MKDLLLLALLLAAPGTDRAGAPVDPAGAATTARPAAKQEPPPRRAGERRAPDARERGGAGGGERAPAKDAAPCEPVKPCPID